MAPRSRRWVTRLWSASRTQSPGDLDVAVRQRPTLNTSTLDQRCQHLLVRGGEQRGIHFLLIKRFTH